MYSVLTRLGFTLYSHTTMSILTLTDGNMLAVGCRDNYIYVYDVTDGGKKYVRVGRCSGHSSFVTHVDWSMDGEYIRSNSGDYEVLYWHAKTCKQETQKDDIRDLDWATQNCTLAFAAVGVWPDGADGTDINNCSASHNKKLLASADDYGKVNLYEYPSIQPRMYQDQNGNYQYVDYLLPRDHARSILPAIYEERYQHNVPDINLECDESIDNWDDLQLGIYSPERNDKLPGSDYNTRNLTDGQHMVGNDFSSYAAEMVDGQLQSPMLLLHNYFVNNLLRDGKDADGICQPALDEATSSQESVNTYNDEQLDITDDTFRLTDSANSSNDQDESVGLNSQSSSEMDTFQQLPVYDISSRSSSPSIIEILSNAEYDFANYRSISPLIVRSPTPLSSRSSSPRMFRSPSPLEFLEHSFSELPIDDPSDLIFYEDRYILRSYSPVLATNDQQVPDVNTEFRRAVTDAIEFPSFRNYVRDRTLSSCHDQVVPECIEE